MTRSLWHRLHMTAARDATRLLWCPACGQFIQRGDPMRKRRGRWEHDVCPQNRTSQDA